MGYPNKQGFYRDGLFRVGVKNVSTGSSRYDIPVDESGSLYELRTVSTMNFVLPKASSKFLGLRYEFAIQEQASSVDVKIRCDVNDSSAVIQGALSSIVDSHTTIIPGSTFYTGARLTAVSSIIWMLEQVTAMGYSFSSGATDAVGGWTTG